MMERPFDRTYWVLDGKLLAGCYPGDADLDKARGKLSAMLDFGVRHFVNLMEPDERDWYGQLFAPYNTVARELAQARGIELSFSRFAIRDLEVPRRVLMEEILRDIDRAVDSGRTVYVHCFGGRGRTGSVVGCWLVRHGAASGAEALERIGELRLVIPEAVRGPSPETPGQAAFVRGWR